MKLYAPTTPLMQSDMLTGASLMSDYEVTLVNDNSEKPYNCRSQEDTADLLTPNQCGLNRR
jgi:hypothetical protein